jgi:hypoxanthine-guanine phosphoribosyltransferase
MSPRADSYDIHADVGDILFTKEQLAAKTVELGKVLGKEYAGKRPLLMPILKGGFICKSWVLLSCMQVLKQLSVPAA